MHHSTSTALVSCVRFYYSVDIIQIATCFWLIAWICLISPTILLISWLFFTMDRKFQKSHKGPPTGSRGYAPASVLRTPVSAPLFGPGGGTPCDFSIFPPIVKTKSRYSAKKSEIFRQIHATQQKITSLCVYDCHVYAYILN